MPRADSGYLHNFMVSSWVFKGDESESDVKTNSGPRVRPFLVEGPHFTCVERAQCPLLAHRVSTHTHTHTHARTERERERERETDRQRERRLYTQRTNYINED